VTIPPTHVPADPRPIGNPQSDDGFPGAALDPGSGSGASPTSMLVDYGGVIHDDTVWIRWLYRLLRDPLGRDASFDRFTSTWNAEFADRVHCGHVSFEEAVREFLRGAGLAPCHVAELCAAAVSRRRVLDASPRAFPGVRTALLRVSAQGWKMSLFACCAYDGSTVRDQVRRMGIDDCFQEILASRDLARSATDNVWQAALVRLGVSPSSILFVSSRPARLQGAVAAGMRCLGVDVPQAPPGIPVIDQIRELPRAVPPPGLRSRAG